LFLPSSTPPESNARQSGTRVSPENLQAPETPQKIRTTENQGTAELAATCGNTRTLRDSKINSNPGTENPRVGGSIPSLATIREYYLLKGHVVDAALLREQPMSETRHNPDLIEINHEPFNAETPPDAFRHFVTPTRNTYVRTNFSLPAIGSDHQLIVAGAVADPFSIDIPGLHKMPQHKVLVTTECAGNDRTGMSPRPEGEPWGSGALSTSHWEGVRLADLLARVKPNADAREVLAVGADAGVRADSNNEVVFARSLPLVDAMSPDTIVALGMNGEMLSTMRGGPTRLIVPGWYGMASVKWLTRLDVLTEDYTGYFQRQRYVYDNGREVRPVTRTRVKSMIVSPQAGEHISTAVATVWGWAWSGNGRITSVEITMNVEPKSCLARLEPPVSRHAWTRWEVQLPIRSPGEYSITSNATDESGASQPEQPSWNRLGYGNNATRAVRFSCR
jgi:DMSO/TMAO reductase YedYZ molybdopterin-dependent catalytic subunit